MDFDISPILDNWDYESGHVMARRFVGQDGEEKIQLRVDLGLLQMNVNGRPDGRRPGDFATAFDLHVDRLGKHRAENVGSDEGFTLEHDACIQLKQEAIQYHHRYICLLQMEDYDRVIRDTKRNIKVFDFVDKYAASPELAWDLNVLRPQLLMMQTRAQAELQLKAKQRDEAIAIVEQGIDAIRGFFLDHERLDMMDQSDEVFSLSDWLEELRNPDSPADAKREASLNVAPPEPLSQKEQLELEMAEAVEREDYERAAEVRDAIRELENSGASH